jgi:iron complex transport system ATP-binding protein
LIARRASAAVAIRGQGLGLSYGDRQVLRDVDLQVAPGELVALVGPNGAGKTTLLRVLSGVLRPQRGSVWLGEGADQRELPSLTPREVARLVGVVEQDIQPGFAFTVRQVVELGRTPHLQLLQQPGQRDREAVERALCATGLSALGGRELGTLSSGERQRVYIALALAQEPRILLLDEPTAHLDIRYAVEIFALIRGLAAAGLAVLVTVHDLNLAAWADRVALLSEGGLLAQGPAAEVLTGPLLSRVFGTEVLVLQAEGYPRPVVMPAGLRLTPAATRP